MWSRIRNKAAVRARVRVRVRVKVMDKAYE